MTTEQRIAKLMDWLDHEDFDPNTTPWLKEMLGLTIWAPPRGNQPSRPYTLIEFFSWDHWWDDTNNRLLIAFEFVAFPYGTHAEGPEDFESPSLRFIVNLDAQEIVEFTIDHNKLKFYEAIYTRFLANTPIAEETEEFKILYGKSKSSI